MPYVKRDKNNNIVGIFSNPTDDAYEFAESATLYKSESELFKEKRRKEYSKSGVTIDAIIIAMWEGDHSVIDEIESKRQAVKEKYQKP